MKPRRIIAATVIVVSCLIALAIWRLSVGGSTPSETSQTATTTESPSASATRARILNAFVTAPTPPPKGALSIRGRVTSAGRPVAAALVTATSGAGDDVLSAMKCACDNSCGEPLLSCACGESAHQLVELVRDRHGEAPPITRSTTAADGSFVLDGLGAGPFALWAEKANGGIGLLRNVAGGSSDVEIRLSEGMSIEGAVQDDAGKPIGGAVVTAIYAEHSRFFDALSDAQGKFRIAPVPLGKYAIVGVHGSLLPDRDSATPERRKDLVLKLLSARRISGRILRDGHTVEAQVTLTGSHRRLPKVVTDRSGRFSFADLRPAQYVVRAAAGEDAAVKAVQLEIGKDLQDVSLELGPAATVAGAVRSRAGAPIAGAHVRYWKGSDGAAVDTGADGSFRVAGLQPGSWSFRATARGYVGADVKDKLLAVGAPTVVEIVIDPAAPGSGVVVSRDGKPVADAMVTATAQGDDEDVDAVQAYLGDQDAHTSATATTKADGSFELDSLPAGPYRVRIEHDRYQPAEDRATLPVAGLRFTLEPGARIEGSVAEDDGAPVVGARVILERSKGSEEVKSTFSDGEGKFSIDGVPREHLTLRATIGGYESGQREASIAVDAPQSALVVRFPAGASIAGTVTDPAGAPVADAMVIVARKTDRKKSDEPTWRRTQSDSTGGFTVAHLPPGQYSIAASKDGSRPASNDEQLVSGGDRGVHIVLQPGFRIRGRVLKPDGTPAASFQANGKAVNDPSGKFDVPVAPSRGYRMSYARFATQQSFIIQADGFAPATRPLPEDLDADMDLGDVVLSMGRTISGRVVEADTGAPLAGVSILLSVGGDYQYSEQVRATTNMEGHFALTSVEDRIDTVHAILKGYAPWKGPPNPGQPMTIALSKGAHIVGTVRSRSGAGVRGTSVFARSADGGMSGGNGVSKADGAFEIAGLSPGMYEITVMSSKPFSPLNVDLSTATEARADFVERAGGTTVHFDVDSENEPEFITIVPGDYPPPTTPKEWVQMPGLRPSPDDDHVFEAIEPGHYTVFFGTIEPGQVRFDRVAIEVAKTVEQHIPLHLAPHLPFLARMR